MPDVCELVLAIAKYTIDYGIGRNEKLTYVYHFKKRQNLTYAIDYILGRFEQRNSRVKVQDHMNSTT